jgi:excisionase family DNA binding protein
LPISEERALPSRTRGVDMGALLLKVPEAAVRLGVSRAKLYELIASGALPAVKIDRCRRVR